MKLQGCKGTFAKLCECLRLPSAGNSEKDSRGGEGTKTGDRVCVHMCAAICLLSCVHIYIYIYIYTYVCIHG